MFKNWSKRTSINISCSLSAYKLDYCIFRHLKQFGYIRCDIILLFLIYSLVVILSASCVCPDILCITRCLQFQKCNNVTLTDLYERPDFCTLNSPDLSTFISKYGAASVAEKKQDVDDLRQNLIDAWVGVKQSVINDGIDQWRRRLHACIRATAGHSQYSLWYKLAKTLLTVIN